MYDIITDTTALDWTPTGWPGVFMKLLHQAGSTGASNAGVTGLTRMAAGSTIPAHRHTHADQTVFVIEGDLVDDGVSYGPGSFLLARAGTPHGPHGSAGGCVLLTAYFEPVDFVAVE